MTKIVIIGAGGFSFPLKMLRDMFTYPALQDATYCLYDIHSRNLTRTYRLAKELMRHHGLPAGLERTTSLKKAVQGAKYVFVTFQVGGIDAYRFDVEIPRKYGVDQCVGDTLGPGGVFRGLRSIHALDRICNAMEKYCPEALILNYANPMSILCWYLNQRGLKAVGLCHSVQGTSRLLAKHIRVPYDDIVFRCGGINHQAWFTEFRTKGGQNLYPRIRKVMQRRFGMGGRTDIRHGSGDALGEGHDVDYYYFERVRTELMMHFGYFHTESSHHGSEYLPWFRKNARTIKQYLPERWDYYRICRKHDFAAQERQILKQCKEPLVSSLEYGAAIVNAMETGVPVVIYGNVPNYGAPGGSRTAVSPHIISNLPRDCCVEVACLVDRNGVQPTVFGALPVQLAAVNRRSINVQELTVASYVQKDAMLAMNAVAMDELTGVHCRLREIRSMTADLIKAESQWLPLYLKRAKW